MGVVSEEAREVANELLAVNACDVVRERLAICVLELAVGRSALQRTLLTERRVLGATGALHFRAAKLAINGQVTNQSIE